MVGKIFNSTQVKALTASVSKVSMSVRENLKKKKRENKV